MSYVGCIGCNVQVKRLGTTSNHYPETPYSQTRKYPDFPFLMMPKRSSLGSDVLGHFLRIFFLTLPRCQDFDTFHGDTGGCRGSCSSRISTKPDSRQCYISKTSDLFLWIRICKVPKSKSKESKACKFEETEETTKLQNNAKHCQPRSFNHGKQKAKHLLRAAALKATSSAEAKSKTREVHSKKLTEIKRVDLGNTKMKSKDAQVPQPCPSCSSKNV